MPMLPVVRSAPVVARQILVFSVVTVLASLGAGQLPTPAGSIQRSH